MPFIELRALPEVRLAGRLAGPCLAIPCVRWLCPPKLPGQIGRRFAGPRPTVARGHLRRAVAVDRLTGDCPAIALRYRIASGPTRYRRCCLPRPPVLPGGGPPNPMPSPDRFAPWHERD